MTATADRIERALDSVDGRLNVTATIKQDSDGHPLTHAHLLLVEYLFELDDDYAEETITVGTATVFIDEHASRAAFMQRHTRRDTGTTRDIVNALADAGDDRADRLLSMFDGRAVALLADVRIPDAADTLLGTVLDSIENSFPMRTVGVTLTLPTAWNADGSVIDIASQHGYQQWGGLHLRQRGVS